MDDVELLLNSQTSLDDDELSSYLKFNLSNITNKSKLDVIAWWKGNQNEFPVLSKIAKDFLTIQPTSVPLEELFSESGLLITEKRSNLNEDTVKACMCLKSWNKNIF